MFRAACITTKASPPVAPEAPYVAVPAAANSLQLEWPEPWGCGAPVMGYLVDMARADAVLTVQGPPTPPQVQPCMHPQTMPCPIASETVGQGTVSAPSLLSDAKGSSSTDSKPWICAIVCKGLAVQPAAWYGSDREDLGSVWRGALMLKGELQEGAGKALTSSLTSISEPLQQLAPSVASSMDAEECASVCASAAGDAASVSEQGRPRPSRAGRRGSKRKGPWTSVYSGPERTCRVDGEPKHDALNSSKDCSCPQKPYWVIDSLCVRGRGNMVV